VNYKRKHRRGQHTREVSSDYRYEPLEKGHSYRGRHSVAKWIAKANWQLKEYLGVGYHAR
jgi:hypothetical protein